ncbi:MAG: S1C family serine protease [Lachnospiraceae bacterium]
MSEEFDKKYNGDQENGCNANPEDEWPIEIEEFPPKEEAAEEAEKESAEESVSTTEYRFTGPFYNDNTDYQYGENSQQTAFSQESEGSQQSGNEEPKQETSNKKIKKVKKGGFGKTLTKAACIALVCGLVGGGAFLGVVHFGGEKLGIGAAENQNSYSITKDMPSTSQAVNTSIKNSIDVSDIAEGCLPSIVSITNKGVQEVRTWFGTYQQEASSSGSGIIIGKNDTELLIVTNYHVVSGSSELSVYFSFEEGEEEKNVVSATIKGYEAQKDLAVISVKLSDIPEETMDKIVIASLGDSSEVKIGEQVVAIGNAMGCGQSVTTGIISALNRPVTVELDNVGTITNNLIQTDAAINFGNSGGALVNMRGEVIGINAAKFSSEAENMGYAIPISDVEGIIGELINRETRDKVDEEKSGYLGITCVDVTEDVSNAYGMPVGVYVNEVVKGSAADKAGIKAGDIIVKMEGSTVASYAELKEQLGYYEAGETVEIVVRERASGYEEKTCSVTLSSKSEAVVK